jgi:hypothetical protein
MNSLLKIFSVRMNCKGRINNILTQNCKQKISYEALLFLGERASEREREERERERERVSFPS